MKKIKPIFLVLALTLGLFKTQAQTFPGCGLTATQIDTYKQFVYDALNITSLNIYPPFTVNNDPALYTDLNYFDSAADSIAAGVYLTDESLLPNSAGKNVFESVVSILPQWLDVSANGAFSILSVDTNQIWAKNLASNIFPTGKAVIDNLHFNYGVDYVSRSINFDGTSNFALSAPQKVNLIALDSIFKVEGLNSNILDVAGGDRSKVYFTAPLDGTGMYYEYRYGPGCPTGCAFQDSLKVQVASSCDVTAQAVIGVGLDDAEFHYTQKGNTVTLHWEVNGLEATRISRLDYTTGEVTEILAAHQIEIGSHEDTRLKPGRYKYVLFGQELGDWHQMNTLEVEVGIVDRMVYMSGNFLHIGNLQNQIERVQIYDLQGRLWASIDNYDGKPLDLSKLTAGTYIVKLEDKNVKITKL